MTRAEAARLAGMERQALRDAVTRYNAEGLRDWRPAGLEDRPKPGRPPGLSEGGEAALAALILRSPEPKRSGISSYTRDDIAGLIEKRYHPVHLSEVLKRMVFSRQKARQVHPNADPKAQDAWVKRGFRAR